MKIPLFEIYWDDADINGVVKTLKRGNNWAIGPEIEQFEERISEYIGTKYAISFNSGTSALHAILLAYNLRKGDEIIVPSFSFIATANAVLFVGAKPVFAEIEDKTYGLDPEDVNKRITSKTKAIMPIHYGGCPCLIRELREIADDHGLLLIEDSAEAMGAKIRDKKVGCFGDSAIFSFCQNKIITTGEGGAVTTDSKDIFEKLKLIRSHGRLENGAQNYFDCTNRMDYVSLGYNFRMPSIVAALGISQLEKIDKIIKLRQEKAKYLTEKLKKVNGIVLPYQPPDYNHVYQMFTIRIEGTEITRDKLKMHLENKGIMSKVYFDPIHLTTFYKERFDHKKGDLPITEKLSNSVLTIHTHPMLKMNEMNYIAAEIETFLKANQCRDER